MTGPGLVAARPAAPAAPSQAAVLLSGRRPWLAVASLLLMVVTGGAFVLIHRRGDAQVEVLVVARPVAAGQILAASDVRVARIVPDPAVDVVSAGEASSVVGHAAAVPLVAGSFLSPAEVGPAAWPPAGQVVVAIPVKAARLADGVTAGSHVLVVDVAKDGTGPAPTASNAAASGSQASPVEATVVSVRAGGEGSGTATVSLLVSRPDAVAVAGSSADLSVALARG